MTDRLCLTPAMLARPHASTVAPPPAGRGGRSHDHRVGRDLSRAGLALASLLLAAPAAPAAAQRVPPADPAPYARAIAAGYKAAMVCSGIFTAGRTPAQVDADELAGIYPEYDAIVPTLAARIDRQQASVEVPYDPAMPPRRASWHELTGCTTEPIGSAPGPVMVTDIVTDQHPTPGSPRLIAGPPSRPGPGPADPRRWPLGDAGIAPHPSSALAAAIGRAVGGGYGAGAKTTGVVILRDGQVAAERYAAGWGPFISNRTWSVGKSIAGTLIGLAGVDAGDGLAVQRSGLLPQWRRADDLRGSIKLDHLLRMASGLHSDTAGNRTDAIYFGGTAVEEQAPAWPLNHQPGTHFRYANDDILLAMLAMRQAVGDGDYRLLPPRLFGRLSMAHTTAGVDPHGNYIISSQIWSTARDLARLGQFWLQDGVWQGQRLLPEGWVRYMTTPSGPQPASGPGYGATMWLFGPAQGLPAGSYAAQGNRGQYVMVVPSEHLVVVRRGEDPGAARFDIARFTADVIAAGR